MKRFFILLIISAVFLSACSSTKWVRTTVVKQKGFIVILEQQQEEGQIVRQKYEHPYKIELKNLEKMLKDLTYIEKTGLFGKEEPFSVFQAVEIDRLTPQLADALAKADDSQRIRFTSYNQGRTLIFSVSRETEGVLFITPGGQLNIAFTFINSEIDPTRTSVYPPGFSSADPLRIRTSGTTITSTAPYAELSQLENGKSAPMWVISDLKKLDESIKTSPVSVPVSIVEVKKEVPPAVPVPEMQPATIPETEIKDTAVETEVSGQIPENTLQQDIKNKLKYLKELLDEGLISEKDYNAKKSELLEKIY